MAFGIAGDADLADAVASQQRRRRSRRARCGSRRPAVAVAGDDENMAATPASPLSARQKVVERARCWRNCARRRAAPARSPRPAAGRAASSDLVRRPRRHRAEINAGAGGSMVGERRDLGVATAASPRCENPRMNAAIARDRIERRLILAASAAMSVMALLTPAMSVTRAGARSRRTRRRTTARRARAAPRAWRRDSGRRRTTSASRSSSTCAT